MIITNLIKVVKSKIFFIIIGVSIFSCASLNDIKSSSIILFGSVYDNDLCSLTINNKNYFDGKSIITERSLGIDTERYIELKTDTLKIIVSFIGVVDKGLNAKRVVRLDTTLLSINGKNILIRAGGKKIFIEQQSTPFVLE